MRFLHLESVKIKTVNSRSRSIYGLEVAVVVVDSLNLADSISNASGIGGQFRAEPFSFGFAQVDPQDIQLDPKVSNNNLLPS
jgi:hypothetical protein